MQRKATRNTNYYVVGKSITVMWDLVSINMVASQNLYHVVAHRLISMRLFRRKTVKSSRTKAKNRKRDRMYGLKVMEELSQREFQRMFRLSRTAFAKLVELVTPLLSKNEAQAKKSSGSCISVVTKLAVTLRWLAGGSYLDISRLFGVDEHSFWR